MPNLIKTQLAVEIYEIFKSMDITQEKFSTLLGIRQSKVSRIINGHLNEFSIDVLIEYLQKLNRYVEIKISLSSNNIDSYLEEAKE